MPVVFSKHAKERMLQRGINEETVKSILECPDFVRSSFGERRIATKHMEKNWHVIFLEKAESKIVISVYSD